MEAVGLPHSDAVPQRSRLTKRRIDAAKKGPARRILWDSELIGFGLSLSATGCKSYILKYRHRGQQRWFTIGRHGSPWTVEGARKEALRLLGEVARGVDPAVGKQADRRGQTVAQLCDQYLREGVGHKKASTLTVDRGRIECHIKPLLGGKRVDAVTRTDVEQMRDAVKAGKTAIAAGEERQAGSLPRGGAGAAAQTMALLSAILTFAINRGLRETNPCHGVKRQPTKKLTRFLSEAEIGRLATSLDDYVTRGGNAYAIAAIRLLLLTGCRRGEILSLRWDVVSVEQRCLNLGDSKTGAKTVYLNAPAVALLQALPRIDGNPYVIAGERRQHLQSLDKVWRAVRVSARISDCRLHDLRRSHASIGVSSGASLPIISKLLGHASPSMTARYSHLAEDPVRATSEAIGARIAAAMNPRAKDAEIIELREQRP
jgi:integrase